MRVFRKKNKAVAVLSYAESRALECHKFDAGRNSDQAALWSRLKRTVQECAERWNVPTFEICAHSKHGGHTVAEYDTIGRY